MSLHVQQKNILVFGSFSRWYLACQLQAVFQTVASAARIRETLVTDGTDKVIATFPSKSVWLAGFSGWPDLSSLNFLKQSAEPRLQEAKCGEGKLGHGWSAKSDLLFLLVLPSLGTPPPYLFSVNVVLEKNPEWEKAFCFPLCCLAFVFSLVVRIAF